MKFEDTSYVWIGVQTRATQARHAPGQEKPCLGVPGPLTALIGLARPDMTQKMALVGLGSPEPWHGPAQVLSLAMLGEGCLGAGLG